MSGPVVRDWRAVGCRLGVGRAGIVASRRIAKSWVVVQAGIVEPRAVGEGGLARRWGVDKVLRYRYAARSYTTCMPQVSESTQEPKLYLSQFAEGVGTSTPDEHHPLVLLRERGRIRTSDLQVISLALYQRSFPSGSPVGTAYAAPVASLRPDRQGCTSLRSRTIWVFSVAVRSNPRSTHQRYVAPP